MRIIYTGADAKIPVQLTETIDPKIGKQPFIIDPAKVVRAILVNSDNTAKYMATPVTVSPATPGSDWTKSLIMILFPGAATSEIDFQGRANIEIQVAMEEGVDDRTWLQPVLIKKGFME